MANLYLSFCESEIIEPKVNSGEILYYSRYADDTLLASNDLKVLEQTFSELNNFHENLKWTSESMVEKSLTFLDTRIYWDNQTMNFELCQFQKETKSDCIMNFNKNIVPKNTKIGILVGEIYRCRTTTTTEKQLENALSKLTSKFLKNGYSKSVITEKIREVKARDFQKSPKSDRYKDLRKDPNNKFHYFTAQFIDSRCQKIERKIKKHLTKITPNFFINFCWSSKTLESIILPRLKHQLDPFSKSGTVYQFTCQCGSSYIGESQRQLSKRIQEHGQKVETVKFFVTYHNVLFISQN